LGHQAHEDASKDELNFLAPKKKKKKIFEKKIFFENFQLVEK
jgi:hypothetical protein